MDEVHHYPFQTVTGAIGFYCRRNPARQKFINVLEPENKGSEKGQAEDFSGESPRDIWASVVAAIKKSLENRTFEERKVFEDFYFDAHKRIDDIAADLKISPSKCYRMLNKTIEDLEKELIRRQLIAPLDENRS